MRVFKAALAAQEAELTNAILNYDDTALNKIIFTESDVLEMSAEEDGLDDDSQEWLDARAYATRYACEISQFEL